jgi:hypothetical protein
VGQEGETYYVLPGMGDIEGQDLVGVPRGCHLVHAADVGDDVVELVDGVADGGADRTYDRAVVDGVHAGIALLEAGTDLVDVGYELALGFVEQVEQCVMG